MKNYNSLKLYSLFSAISSIILGTLLHFTFEWSGDNSIVGLFSAINESTWEHLKLVFFPTIFTIIIGYVLFSKYFPNYLCAKTIGLISSMLFIIVFFYTYTGIIGSNYALLDIGSFFVSIVLGEFLSYKLAISKINFNIILCLFAIILLIFCFFYFTFNPPKINLFRDPISSTYGL